MQQNFFKQVNLLAKSLVIFGVLLGGLLFGLMYLSNHPEILNKKETFQALSPVETVVMDEQVIVESGFINDDGVSLVIQNCTQCHSSKLVTQNRMSYEGWDATITWMQETQNLWTLGNRREPIVRYLAKNYAPKEEGRRANLTEIEWYVLE